MIIIIVIVERKKEMTKKILSILLAFILSFSLVACKDVNKEIDSKNEVESTKESEKESTKESEKESEVESTKEGEVEQISDKRIVAASKTVAEYLALFDQEIIGITKQEALPKMYEGVKQIGPPRKLNLEIIMSLNPDIVIANDNSKKDIEEFLSNQGVKTMYLDSNNHDLVYENIKTIGKALNKEDQANKIVEEMKKKEQMILEKAKNLKGKSYALLFGTGDNFQLVTENSYLGSLLSLIGMENIAKGESGENNRYLPYSLETLVSKDPDYILTLAHGHKEQAKSVFSEEFNKDLWKNLRAVKEDRLIHLDDKTNPLTGNIHMLETLDALIDSLLEKAGN